MTEPEYAIAPDSLAHSALRKVSWRLLPLLALGYGCAYVDRVNISFAAFQMNDALRFSATVYGFGAGLFFLSYAACEVPSNLLLHRFGARRWLARIMITWGILAIAMMFVRTPWQFYSVRFLLGMAEAGYFPGVIYYLTQWFPPDSRARAIGRFYISLPISASLMASVGGTLLNLNGRMHLAGWQWLFLIEGIPPILLSIAFLLWLPDSPSQAAWLSPSERESITAILPAPPAHTPEAEQVGRALLDPRVWQIGIFELFMLFSAYGLILIQPQLIRSSTHLSITYVGFISAATSLLGVPAMLWGASYSDRNPQHRYQNIVLFSFLMAIGLAACGISHTPAVVIPSVCVTWLAFFAMQGPFWTLPASLFRGRNSAAAIAAVNSIGILGGFFGPAYMGVAKDLTGDYQRGLITLSLPMLACAIIMQYMHHKSRQEKPLLIAAVPLAPAVD